MRASHFEMQINKRKWVYVAYTKEMEKERAFSRNIPLAFNFFL
jgi:hypothetical protein